MALAAGTRLGPYEILSPLGVGGMGEVYRGRDTRLDRNVAIKVHVAQLDRDADLRARFEREARAIAGLNHPNICTLYDVGVHEGSTFLVMELLEGESLRSRLSHGRPAVPAIVEIATQLADALEAAHRSGTIHRDIKPENIFITTRGTAKLLDFGIAKLMTEQAAESAMVTATRTGTGPVALGTVAYMSPEQVRGEVLDARTDLFSLGVVLYEMATGQQPFRGTTSGAMLGEILTKAPTAPVKLNADVPAELERIVNKLLEKDRELRYQSARDLRADLERLRRAATAPTREHMTTADRERPSLVVLPFENLSPDPENAFFADGLTEEIITDLSRLHALRVISRNSAMQLKKTTKDTRTIGRELDVRYVLQGTVRRAGDQLRVTAQLVEAASDSHIWAERYTGTLEDVFEIQEKLSRTIVDALKIRLTADEAHLLAARHLPDARTFDLYLEARAAVYAEAAGALDHAEALVRQAIATSGPNAWLYALLGQLQYSAFDLALRPNPGDAAQWSDRALELSPDCGPAFLVKGLLAHMVGDMGAAVGFGRKAVNAGAGADGLCWLSYFYLFAGKHDEARETAEAAIACDPLSWMARWSRAAVAMMNGDLEGALHRMQASLDVGGEQVCIRMWLAICLDYAGRSQEAIRMYSEMESWGGVFVHLSAAYRAVVQGNREALHALSGTPLFATAEHHKEFAWWCADAFARIGDADNAFRFLSKAIDLGIWNSRFWSQVNPAFAPLRDEPRFIALMERAKQKEREVSAEQGVESHAGRR